MILYITKETLRIGLKCSEIIPLLDFTKGTGKARTLIKSGGFYVNNKRITDIDYKISLKDLLEKSQSIVLRKGKKNYGVIFIFEDYIQLKAGDKEKIIIVEEK